MSGIGAGGERRDSGYTLVELIAVLAVVAVASLLAYPTYAGLRRGHELEAAAVGLTQQLRLAQWRAVSSGARARVVSRQHADGTWRFLTQSEQGAAWVSVGDEVPVPRETVVAIAGPAEKTFNPDGTCSLGSITLRGGAGGVYRCTLAAATGRVRFYRGDREAGRGL
jgi:type II secretion system protein H